MNLRNEIKTEALLSSTTYKTNRFDKCIWCDKEVENDYYEFNNDYYQPWRCNCEKAKIELQEKLKLLNILLKLKGD